MPTEKRADERPRIKVHLDKIPEYQIRNLVKPLNTLPTAFFAEPGRREKYEVWLAERNARLATN